MSRVRDDAYQRATLDNPLRLMYFRALLPNGHAKVPAVGYDERSGISERLLRPRVEQG